MTKYYNGSIFYVTYIYTDVTDQYIYRTLLLVQFKTNQFQLIDMETGNRWLDIIIKGKDNVVDELSILKYLGSSKQIYGATVNKIELIRHISDMDIFK